MFGRVKPLVWGRPFLGSKIHSQFFWETLKTKSEVIYTYLCRFNWLFAYRARSLFYQGFLLYDLKSALQKTTNLGICSVIRDY